MIHIFAISSFFSLYIPALAPYLDAIRECYEAFTVYCFFDLLIAFLGGERAVLIMLYSRPPIPYLFPVSLWQKKMDLGDPYTFLRIKRGVMQFVFVKPICASTVLLLNALRYYQEGELGNGYAYVAITAIYNISYSWCLWCLSMFFVACKHDLESFR